MKKTIILAVLLLAVMVTGAQAEPFFAVSGVADAITSNVVVGPLQGKQAVVYYLNFTGLAATTDVNIHQADDTETVLLNAEAAGQTALTVKSCTGFDNNDAVVIADPDGEIIRASTASACNDTTNVMTITAVGPAFQKGAKVYEMLSATTMYADITTGEVAKNGNGSPLIVGKKGKPLLVRASGGNITVNIVSGEYR